MRRAVVLALLAVACGGESERRELAPATAMDACLAWCARFCECSAECVGPKAPCVDVCAWNAPAPACDGEGLALWTCHAENACADPRDVCPLERRALELCSGG